MGAREIQQQKEHIERTAAEVSVYKYSDPVVFLDRVLLRLKSDFHDLGKRYTYTDFAEELGFGRTTYLHQVLKGHRKLSAKSAEKMASALGLEGNDKDYFLCLVESKTGRSAETRRQAFERLLELREKSASSRSERDMITYLSTWYHPVIRELLGRYGHYENPVKEIHSRLSPQVDERMVKQSIDLLTAIGFVSKDETSEKLTLAEDRVVTGHRVKGMDVRTYHHAMLKMALDALQRGQASRQDFSALTIRTTEVGAMKIRKMVHEFQLRVLDLAEREQEGDQVYQMNIQLFPFTE